MNDEREATFNRLLDKLMAWKQTYGYLSGPLIPIETVERILADELLRERRGVTGVSYACDDLSVQCPSCGAEAGQPCTSVGTHFTRNCEARRVVADGSGSPSENLQRDVRHSARKEH
jgi:hypothetical protein